jgi:hypothetical protein
MKHVLVVTLHLPAQPIVQFSMTAETKQKGQEWLLTNGFNHILPDIAGSSRWIRKDQTAIDFREISPWAAPLTAFATYIEATLMPDIALTSVRCEDVD